MSILSHSEFSSVWSMWYSMECLFASQPDSIHWARLVIMTTWSGRWLMLCTLDVYGVSYDRSFFVCLYFLWSGRWLLLCSLSLYGVCYSSWWRLFAVSLNCFNSYIYNHGIFCFAANPLNIKCFCKIIL